MKDRNAELWIGAEDLGRDETFERQSQDEFQQVSITKPLEDESLASSMTSSRRDFLKYLGFGIGAATVAASCEIPIKRAIPYVIKPDEIVPGVATYYASSFYEGGDYCSIIVKTREGRPIKIEGNTLSDITMGGTSARAQASVLSLYDTNRLRGPKMRDGKQWKDTSWEELDKQIKAGITAGGSVRIVSHTQMSPSLKGLITDWKATGTDVELVSYDPVSYAALLDANEKNFGQRAIPNYHFDKVKMVVSFDADFLGTWISPVEYASKFIKTRKIKDVKNAAMSRHIQVESHMSLSGSNADNRILVKPSEQGGAIALLYNELAGLTGASTISAPGINEKASANIKKIAKELAALKGQSIVIAASNNISEQEIVNKINDLLGNIGSTIEFTNASYQRQGSDKAYERLVQDMKSGNVGTVILWDANPVYEMPNGQEFAEALGKVKNSVSVAGSLNETSELCNWLAPGSHFLESWGDLEVKRGQYSLVQPCISPLFDTRQGAESLMVWGDHETLKTNTDAPYYEYLKKYWESNIFPKQSKYLSFQTFWDKSLHDGVVSLPVDEIAVNFSGEISGNGVTKPSAESEIVFFESVNMGAGQFAANPWLMETPDPITRCVWGNYLSVPISFDGDRRFESFQNLEDGDQVDLTINGVTKRVTVVRQFGQMPGTFGLALGYGRGQAGKCGTGVGVDVNPWRSIENGYAQYSAEGVTVSAKVSKDDEFACVQHHHTMGVTARDESTGEKINADEAAIVDDAFKWLTKGYQGSLTSRSIIRKANLSELDQFVDDLTHEREHFAKLNSYTLYPGHDDKYSMGHHWGMHIDLNSCIGCSACTVACMAENNVPVVGKKEVFRHHEMTWLRIDRYYYGDVDNPQVVYQPMMCQHCDNAPCENVCPVNATNHSSEGLNQMAYNRCVGTRYCANNCPYKVRRFNWLDYTTADIFPVNEPALVEGEDMPYGADNLTRMVLNPDVTVRVRGVIEKCSFCVQRIQEGKLVAKKEGRKLEDRDVKTACQTACPTGAITFGDMNNEEGQLSAELASELNYLTLEEVNTRPSVNYKARIHNRDESLDA